jgi:hypothetical protein
MVANIAVKSPAAPTPCSVLPKMRTFIFGEEPDTAEPASKMKIAKSKTDFVGAKARSFP